MDEKGHARSASARCIAVALLVVASGCDNTSLIDTQRELKVQPEVLEFPETWTGTSASLTLTLRNQARAPRAVRMSIAAPFDVARADLELELAGGEVREIPVHFSPVSSGDFSAVLSVLADAARFEIPLVGRGRAPPGCPTLPCHRAQFNPETGTCTQEPLPDGSDCSNQCLAAATCQQGRCAGEPVQCDDGNACTVDACDPAIGCTFPEKACESAENPCRASHCDPAVGCGSVDLPDGTPCGIAACGVAHVCMLGKCEQRQVPSATGCPPHIAVGNKFTCMQQDGGVYCWGDANYTGTGVVGHEPFPAPTPVPNPATMVASRKWHSCAVSAGDVYCWGISTGGLLWNGAGSGKLPIKVTNFAGPAVSVSAGDDHNCAVLQDGTIQCWGRNTYGQLGTGDRLSSSVPVTVTQLPGPAVGVAAGHGHTCALLEDGVVYCWGANWSGQLGAWTNTDSALPTKVNALPKAQAVSAGFSHTCALTLDGGVWCWGANTFGELGDGTNLVRWSPVQVQGLTSGARAIALGSESSCAITEGGRLRCWGINSTGRIGDGTTDHRYEPVEVIGLTGVEAVGTGGGHSCAIVTGGQVYCWGANVNGELGDGTFVKRSLTPSPVVRP